MEKIREIESNSLGISPGYTFKGEFLGHIVQGIVSIEEKADKIGLSEEKKIMLQHMILYLIFRYFGMAQCHFIQDIYQFGLLFIIIRN